MAAAAARGKIGWLLLVRRELLLLLRRKRRGIDVAALGEGERGIAIAEKRRN